VHPYELCGRASTRSFAVTSSAPRACAATWAASSARLTCSEKPICPAPLALLAGDCSPPSARRTCDTSHRGASSPTASRADDRTSSDSSRSHGSPFEFFAIPRHYREDAPRNAPSGATSRPNRPRSPTKYPSDGAPRPLEPNPCEARAKSHRYAVGEWKWDLKLIERPTGVEAPAERCSVGVPDVMRRQGRSPRQRTLRRRAP
jgi:hypothetical protein